MRHKLLRFVVGSVVLLLVVLVGWSAYSKWSVARVHNMLRLHTSRVVSVEVFEQDHCCGGEKSKIVTLSRNVYDELVSAICKVDKTMEYGCKCGTNGTQLVLQLKGKPNLIYVTYVPCGYFVLHDGAGTDYLYFQSKVLHALLRRMYWNNNREDKNAEQIIGADWQSQPLISSVRYIEMNHTEMGKCAGLIFLVLCILQGCVGSAKKHVLRHDQFAFRPDKIIQELKFDPKIDDRQIHLCGKFGDEKMVVISWSEEVFFKGIIYEKGIRPMVKVIGVPKEMPTRCEILISCDNEVRLKLAVDWSKGKILSLNMYSEDRRINVHQADEIRYQ